MIELPAHIEAQVRAAIAEDVGDGDVSAQLIAVDTRGEGRLLCRESAVLCGSAWFEAAFVQCVEGLSLDWFYADGDRLPADSVVCRFSGNARGLLSAERTALNFLQTLSAVATQTAAYVDACAGSAARILDTRKTLPGLRLAQKYAVTCGGGLNHRIGLFDAYLIKENHIAAAGSIAAAVRRARRQRPDLFLEVEVEDLGELRQALEAGVDRVLLDNFSLGQLRAAVQQTQGACELEASGGVTLESVAGIAATGVDFISVGALTKDVQAVDFSIRLSA